MLDSPRESNDAEELLGKSGHEASSCLSWLRRPKGGFPFAGFPGFLTSCWHTLPQQQETHYGRAHLIRITYSSSAHPHDFYKILL